jgi:hypothetical protein
MSTVSQESAFKKRKWIGEKTEMEIISEPRYASEHAPLYENHHPHRCVYWKPSRSKQVLGMREEKDS